MSMEATMFAWISSRCNIVADTGQDSWTSLAIFKPLSFFSLTDSESVILIRYCHDQHGGEISRRKGRPLFLPAATWRFTTFKDQVVIGHNVVSTYLGAGI